MSDSTSITLERPLFDKMLSALKWARTCVPYESDCHHAVTDAVNQAALAQPARAQAGVAELVAQWRVEAAATRRAVANGAFDEIGKRVVECGADAQEQCADALAALGGEDG